jgi:hypothetical protein
LGVLAYFCKAAPELVSTQVIKRNWKALIELNATLSQATQNGNAGNTRFQPVKTRQVGKTNRNLLDAARTVTSSPVRVASSLFRDETSLPGSTPNYTPNSSN